MNKTLAGFFGIKAAAAEIVTEVVEAVVGTSAGEAAETQKETTAEGTDAPAEEITPTVAETVTGEDTDAPVDAMVGEETIPLPEGTTEVEPVVEGIVSVQGEELETPAGVEMAGLPAAELAQIRADAASWNTHKGELAVLQAWYNTATGAGPVSAATVDAADAVPSKKKSWEKAAWNN